MLEKHSTGLVAPDGETVPSTVLEGFVTQEQLAEMLGVGVRTLRRWNHLRFGPPSRRIGRRVIYLQSEVRSWVLAQTGPSPAPSRPGRGAGLRLGGRGAR